MMNWLASLKSFDERALRRCCAWGQPPLLQLGWRWLSASGDGYAYLALALLFSITNVLSGAELSMLAGAFLLELPLYWLLKNSLKRRRPYHILIQFNALHVASDKFSFPSGHTTAAFLFATLIMHWLPMLAPLWLLWAIGVGTSRVALGVHFPSDILAGAVLGTSLALGVLACWG